MFSPLLQQLIDSFSALPGIGPKSAQRLVFQLLQDDKKHLADKISETIIRARNEIKRCAKCRIYTELDLCKICSNPRRDSTQVCVVSGPADVMAIEQAACYRGHYFILHGHLSPIDGVGPQQLGLDQWLGSVAAHGITEVILATNLTVEGEVTASYIATHLPATIKCCRIAHGVPSGGELEYIDGNTLARALVSRTQVNNITEEV
jgi:recombination protein RecR